MGIAYGANYGRPSLDLNFARNKSLIDTISGQNLVTFSRAQANYLTTYVGSDGLIKYASANEPRFDHNPLTGECLGLLIEESRINLLPYSEQFDDASWIKSGSVVVANSGPAPDGSFTADLISPLTTGFFLIKTYLIEGTYTASVFVKDNGAGACTVSMGSGTIGYLINVNTITGAYISERSYGGGTLIGYQINSVGNGWFKISVSATAGHGGILIKNADGTSPSSGIYIWGAQLETGSFPTSYIPTTAAAVTRSADQASITGTNFSRWYNQSEGALFGQFIIPPFSSNTVNSPYVYKIGTSANLTGTGFYIGNNTNQEGSLIYGSGIAHGDIAAGTRVKNAIGYTQSNGTASATVNGAAVSFGTSGTIPIPASDKIDIGNNNSDGRFYLNSTINRITYYPTRLQNFQLQQLTK